jgi:hypothetical protein
MKLKEGTKDYPNKWWETDHRQKTKPRMIGGAFKQKKKERDSSDVHDLQRYIDLGRHILKQRDLKEAGLMVSLNHKDAAEKYSAKKKHKVDNLMYGSGEYNYEDEKERDQTHNHIKKKFGPKAVSKFNEEYEKHKEKEMAKEESNTSPGVDTIELPDRYEGKHSVRNVYMKLDEWAKGEYMRTDKDGRVHFGVDIGRRAQHVRDLKEKGIDARHAYSPYSNLSGLTVPKKDANKTSEYLWPRSSKRKSIKEATVNESRNLPITDGQPGHHKPSNYKYLGVHKASGLHMFQEPGGPKEGFAKRKPGSGDASWHIKRGSHVYEFVSSHTVKEEKEHLDEGKGIVWSDEARKKHAEKDAAWAGKWAKMTDDEKEEHKNKLWNYWADNQKAKKKKDKK